MKPFKLFVVYSCLVLSLRVGQTVPPIRSPPESLPVALCQLTALHRLY